MKETRNIKHNGINSNSPVNRNSRILNGRNKLIVGITSFQIEFLNWTNVKNFFKAIPKSPYLQKIFFLVKIITPATMLFLKYLEIDIYLGWDEDQKHLL